MTSSHSKILRLFGTFVMMFWEVYSNPMNMEMWSYHSRFFVVSIVWSRTVRMKSSVCSKSTGTRRQTPRKSLGEKSGHLFLTTLVMTSIVWDKTLKTSTSIFKITSVGTQRMSSKSSRIFNSKNQSRNFTKQIDFSNSSTSFPRWTFTPIKSQTTWWDRSSKNLRKFSECLIRQWWTLHPRDVVRLLAPVFLRRKETLKGMVSSGVYLPLLW